MVLPALLVLSTLAAADGGATVLQQPSDLRWTPLALVAGARQAVVWGDPATGAYGALRRLPAGAALPWHTHTHDSRAVIVSGTLVVEAEDAAARDMGSGAHVFVPAGRRHRATCAAATDCVYLEQQPGPADFKRVEPPPRDPR